MPASYPVQYPQGILTEKEAFTISEYLFGYSDLLRKTDKLTESKLKFIRKIEDLAERVRGLF